MVSPQGVGIVCFNAIGRGAGGTSGIGEPRGTQVIRGGEGAARGRGEGSLAMLTLSPAAGPQPRRTIGPSTHPSAEQPPVIAAEGGSGEGPAERQDRP